VLKRVLVVTPSIRPGGGPPGYVYNLKKGVEELRLRGELKHTFHFLGEVSESRNRATGERQKGAWLRQLAVSVLTAIGLKPILSRRLRAATAAIQSADLVIFQGFQETYLPRYAKKAGKTVIYMPHSPSIMADEYAMLAELNDIPIDHKHHAKLRKDEADLFAIADVAVFPSVGASGEYRREFTSEINSKRVVYIKSGVAIADSGAADAKICVDSESICVLFVGRYVSHKGYDLYCRAAERVSAERPGVKFFSVGSGPMRRHSDTVIDLGWRDDVFSVLRAVSLIVVPNRIAYYDLLPLECAALAKPLVMTAVGGSTDQLADLPDSISCATADVLSLSAAMAKALDVFAFDRGWGTKNKISFEREFTAAAFAKRWDLAIAELVS
jgi:hypothetical protein